MAHSGTTRRPGWLEWEHIGKFGLVSYAVLGPHGGQAWGFAHEALVNDLWH